MHKKSMEASQKLKEEEERTGEDEGLSRLMSDIDAAAAAACTSSRCLAVEDRRTESIKLLRAKAQSYSAARMLHALHDRHVNAPDFITNCSGFQSPSVTMVTTGC